MSNNNEDKWSGASLPRRIFLMTATAGLGVATTSSVESLEEAYREAVKTTGEGADVHGPDTVVIKMDNEYVAVTSSGELVSDSDAVSVLQSATDAAEPGDLLSLCGHFEIQGEPWTIEKDLQVIGYDATIDIVDEDSSVRVQVEGEYIESEAMTAGATSGDFEFSVNDTSIFDESGLVVVRRDTIPYIDGSGMGEMTQVETIDESTDTITTYDSVFFDYPQDDNARLTAIDPIEVTFEGFDFAGVSRDDGETWGIEFRNTVDSSLTNCTFREFGNKCVRFRQSYNGDVRQCQFYDGEGTGGEGYGVAVGGATTNTEITNCEFHNLRHAVGCTTPGPGVPKEVRVFDNYVTGGVNGPFDAHGGTLSVTWKDNVVDTQKDFRAFYPGAFINRIMDNVVYGGTLVFDRGPDQNGSSYIIRGNTIYGNSGFCIRLRRSAPLDDVIIEDNTWYGTHTGPISIEENVTGHLRIAGNTITDMGGADSDSPGIKTTSDRINGGVIKDNYLENVGQSGIRINAGDALQISDNQIVAFNRSGRTTGAGIHLGDVRNSIISNNILRITDDSYSHSYIYQNSPTEDALRNRYNGNILRGPAGRGINILNDADSIIVVDNSGNDDATSTEPADPPVGTEYLDDGTNREDSAVGYRYWDGNEWHDL